MTWRDGESTHTKDLRASARRPAGCKYTIPTSTATPPGGFPGPDAPAETTAPAPSASGTAAPTADRDTAGTGGDASGGGLPVTGAAGGTIAGGAALLLAVGAVLLVTSRRRKVRFTP